jgi:ABC-type phosphate/phosphonate transport system substrate-binding protein
MGAALLAAGLVLVLGAPGRPQAAEGRKATGLRIGVVETLFRDTPERVVQVVMRPFKALLQAQTGMSGELFLAGDALTLGGKLKEDKFQLGVFHGVEFAWARQEYPDLRPLIIAVNRHRALHACLVVRRDSKAAGPADLKGQAFALPRGAREHCHLFLQRRCVPAGVSPAKFYARLSHPADGEAALDAVADGKAQGTVVDAAELEGFRKGKPGRARRLKVLLRSEAFPCGVIACHKGRFSPAQLKRFRAGLVKARSTPRGRQLLQMLRLSGFEAVPADYSASLDAIAKAYPPPQKLSENAVLHVGTPWKSESSDRARIVSKP